MIERKFLIYLRLLILYFFVINCDNDRNGIKTSVAKNQLETFNTKQEEIKFNDVSHSEQWILLSQIIKKQYYNNDEVKEWLNKKVKQKVQHPNDLTQKFLKVFMYDLLISGYDDTALFLANFSIYSQWGKKYYKNHAIPALILSDHYKNRHNLDSLVKYNTILKRYISTESLKIIPINFHMNQAEIEEKKGDFFQSIVQYYKALDYIEQFDYKNLAIVHHNLAVTYLNLEYFDKALAHLNKSLKYSSVEDLPLYKLNTIGIIYSKSNTYDKSERIYLKAIKKAKEEQQLMVLAQSYANYGNLKRKKQDFTKALAFMKTSDSICLAINLDFGILINYINRAEVYFDQGLFREAANELKKGRRNFEAINDIKLNKEFYHLFYRIQDSLGNETEADKYYRLYNENRNKYFGDLSKTIIVEWQLENQKNNALKKEAQYELNLEKKNRKMVYLSSLFLLLLLFIIIVYFIIYRRNHREKRKLELEKQKIAYELEIKSKELLADTLKSISISTVKENIYNDIQSILTELPKSHQDSLVALAKKIKQTGNLSVFEEFNTRFTGVYENFYKKLKEIAPDLTPSEMNICALIRLNLTSKEIAVLTNRTERTIENIRVSIRKKMKLSPESNLQQELWNL